MNAVEAIHAGLRRSMRTPRLILFAWGIQLLLAIIVALPATILIDRAVRGTVYEDILLQRLDADWLGTFQYRNQTNDLASLLSPSITSVGPFLTHVDDFLRAGPVRTLAAFFGDALFGFSLRPGSLTVVLLVLAVALFANTVVSAGFISTYRNEYPPTIAEFLSMGGSYFGPFVRILLVSFLLYALIILPLIDWMSDIVATATAASASEATPFLWYMLRNIIALALFAFVSLSVDVARVRMVLERRTSALVAVLDGVRFVFSRLASCSLIILFYLLLTIMAMAAVGVLLATFEAASAPTMILLFLVHQSYMVFRSFARASLYASETMFVQSATDRS